MQRCLMVFIATHATVQCRGVLDDNGPNFVGEVSCDRGENVVSCPATDKKVSHCAMRCIIASVPSYRPTDHLQFVIVTSTDDVTASIREPSHNGEVTGCRRPVHGIGVV